MIYKILIQCAPNEAQHLHITGIVNELSKHYNVELTVLKERGYNSSSFDDVLQNKNVIMHEVVCKPKCFETVARQIRRIITKGKVTDAVYPFFSFSNIEKYYDAIVVTDLINGKKLKSLFPNSKIVWALHGAISNGYITRTNSESVDLILSPGKTTTDSFNDTKAKVVEVGSNKIHTCGLLKNDNYKLESMFNNNNKTFLYNPHFNKESGASSWYDHGEELIEFFSNHEQYNLIVSPHPFLSKNIDQYKLIDKFKACKNIKFDFGLTNTSTLAYDGIIDGYIGDISSHALEYMSTKPRLFIFHRGNNNKSVETMLMYSKGLVFDNVDDLVNLVNKSLSEDEIKIQQDYIKTVFANVENPNIVSAKAILDLL